MGHPSDAKRPPVDDKAAQLLALRPHFRRELERKLARVGYGPEEVAVALDRLARMRLLDDVALARAFVDTVARRKGYGRMRIAQELARRGAPEEGIQAALAGHSADEDLERAREAARRWSAKRAGDPQALARHLDAKGFAGNAIFKVLKEMALAAPDGEAEPAAED